LWRSVEKELASRYRTSPLVWYLLPNEQQLYEILKTNIWGSEQEKMNSFKLFGLKRTRLYRIVQELDIFCPIETFFELHPQEWNGQVAWLRKENQHAICVQR